MKTKNLLLISILCINSLFITLSYSANAKIPIDLWKISSCENIEFWKDCADYGDGVYDACMKRGIGEYYCATMEGRASCDCLTTCLNSKCF